MSSETAVSNHYLETSRHAAREQRQLAAKESVLDYIGAAEIMREFRRLARTNWRPNDTQTEIIEREMAAQALANGRRAKGGR